jgi:hypothetical protein
MLESERVLTVMRLLHGYVESPSLKHIRDANSIAKPAKEIVEAVDQASSIWRKWDGDREVLLKSVLCCWIPEEDMWEYLNTMPGHKLTKADVSARFRAFLEELPTRFKLPFASARKTRYGLVGSPSTMNSSFFWIILRLVDLWIEFYPKLSNLIRERVPLTPNHFLTPRG